MIRVFPVAGQAHFTDDFGYVRTPGGPAHQGIDVFGSEGTPLVAVDDGEVHFGTDVLGGNIANVYASDGSRYYYAHLQAFEGVAGVKRQVRAGDVIGYLGKTGNAASTSPHVHFEEHPGNGPAVDPFNALSGAPHVTASRSGSQVAQLARGIVYAGLASAALWSAWSLLPRSTKNYLLT